MGKAITASAMRGELARVKLIIELRKKKIEHLKHLVEKAEAEVDAMKAKAKAAAKQAENGPKRATKNKDLRRRKGSVQTPVNEGVLGPS